MSKQLRLEVAELSDVGRRRDSNEDNMTRYVPKDSKIMERKGAIFVVADGMGGHAAGEVASEIAVEAIREEYYEAESDGVIEGLQHAIKQANRVIYERATEQAGRAGMGTTCVAVVTRGPLAYIANVGDSRVYLIRDGQMRQLTNDHSWVAEQVRAGMLTDEQARTHAHRNVITRALGTQAEVEPDLFVEVLQEGDRLLLCTDGLSGPVSDPEMNRIISSSPPQEAVRALIAQANEQGGPDNITAVLIHVQEVPPVPPEMEEQLATLIDASKRETVGLKPVKKLRKRLSPLKIAIRSFAVVAILFLSLAGWDVAFGPVAWTRAAHNQLNTDLGHAQALVAQAQQEQAPQAIETLASAQYLLLKDLHNSWLSSDDRQRATMVLQQTLGPVIRQALREYNAQALVTPLSALQTQHFSFSCGTASGGQVDRLAAIQGSALSAQGGSSPGEMPQFFVRTRSTVNTSAVYPLMLNQPKDTLTCGSALDSSVVDFTADGSQLYLLDEPNAATFTLETAALPDLKPQVLLTLPTDPQGALPSLLAVHGSEKYILYRGTVGDTVYRCPDAQAANCKPMTPAPLPKQVHSMAIGPDGTLYLLLVDGSLGVLTPAGLHPANLGTLLPVLPVTDPDAFDPLTPLPTIPTPSTFSASASSASANIAAPSPSPTSTAVSAPSATPTSQPPYMPQGVKLMTATTLVSDQQNHLFIGDGADYRIIRLDVPGTGSKDPVPTQQYADASALNSLLSVAAVDTGKQGLALYVLSDQALLAITIALP